MQPITSRQISGLHAAADRRAAIVASLTERFSGRPFTESDVYRYLDHATAEVWDHASLKATVDVLSLGEQLPALHGLPGHIRNRIVASAGQFADGIDPLRVDFNAAFCRFARALDFSRSTNGSRWLITVYVSDGGSGARARELGGYTFSSDNWWFLRHVALMKRAPTSCGIVLRRFESQRDPVAGIPFKSMGGVAIAHDRISGLSADLIRESFELGNPHRRVDPTIRFVPAAELLPSLFGA